ncbi:MAG: pirin family protein, partial [Taibaiella sp.]|nr:pirin family protein [Taibaiella sp.]
MANIILHKADERGHADHGWLNARHSFSFAGYRNPEKVHFGALRVLNDDIVAPGMGFGKHPHDNMEIITIILDGELEHKDSMGHAQKIVPGEVQVMSAGTGVQHSEANGDRHKPVNLLQSWIFPDKRDVTPRYEQKAFDPAERINKFHTLVSPMDNDDEGLKIYQQAWIYRTTLEAGNTVQLHLHSGQNGAYVFLIDGAISAAGQPLG